MTAPDALLSQFVAEAAQLFRPRQPESFWECETAFRNLLESEFLPGILNTQLRRLAADPYHRGSWLANELILHRGGGLVLALSQLTEPKRFIHGLPFYAMYAPVSPEGLDYERYRLPVAYHNEVFDPSLKLERVDSGSVQAGDILGLQSDRYAYDFKLARPALVLRFMTTAFGTQEWLFSRNDLRAWQANDADISFTQLRVAAYVLGKFAHQSSETPLKLMAGHPHHAVRWAAIQNLGRLSRTAALDLLREAVSDPHPHVQRAARKTLEQLERTHKG